MDDYDWQMISTKIEERLSEVRSSLIEQASILRTESSEPGWEEAAKILETVASAIRTY